MRTIASTLGLLAMLWLFGGLSAEAAEPLADQFDLSHWKLTLPVNEKGKLAGHAAEIPADRLADGYAHPDYFQIGSNGTITFWAPVCGSTTDNSGYPRSELRELLDPADPSVNWSAQGTHVLKACCRVTRVPSSQKVIIGQIHSYSGKALPLIKLQFFKNRVEALVKRSPSKGGDQKLELAKVGLDDEIAYEIRLQAGELRVIANGSTQRVNILKNDLAWADQTFYFKAGAYCQDNDGPPSEGARVVFSRLRVTHSKPQP